MQPVANNFPIIHTETSSVTISLTRANSLYLLLPLSFYQVYLQNVIFHTIIFKCAICFNVRKYVEPATWHGPIGSPHHACSPGSNDPHVIKLTSSLAVQSTRLLHYYLFVSLHTCAHMYVHVTYMLLIYTPLPPQNTHTKQAIQVHQQTQPLELSQTTSRRIYQTPTNNILDFAFTSTHRIKANK